MGRGCGYEFAGLLSEKVEIREKVVASCARIYIGRRI